MVLCRNISAGLRVNLSKQWSSKRKGWKRARMKKKRREASIYRGGGRSPKGWPTTPRSASTSPLFM
jgi:hypothetical protein